MTNSVTVNGNTYNDGSVAPNNMDAGGFRTNLIPMLSDAVVDLAAKVSSASTSQTSAAASAASAIAAPGTNATSTTSLTISPAQQTLTIQTGKSIVAGAAIMCAVTASASTNYMHGVVDSYNSGTGALLFTPDSYNGSGTFAAWTVSVAGIVGAEAGAVRFEYTFSTTTTDADPGNGTLRLDNATQNLSTTIRADLLDRLGVDMTSVLGTLTASTSLSKGTIRLVKRGDPSKFLLLNMTAMASPAGYRNITCSVQASSSASPFANGDSIVLHFSRTGDAAGSGGLNAGNIAVGRTMDSTYAGVQIATPTAVGVKDTLPDATTLVTGIGNYFHKNGSDTCQWGLSDKGGTLRAVMGPNGKASSNLADKSTAAGIWAIECDNEDGALSICEQALASTYTGVLVLQDGNGGASRVNHARTKTACFISNTAAVSVVTSGSSTYLVGFDDTGLSTPQLLEAAVATIACVIRANATGGIVIWTQGSSVKYAGFTMTGNAPSVGTVSTLTGAAVPGAAASSGASGGICYTTLDSLTTWIVATAGATSAGNAFAFTLSGNTATAGAARALNGTGGLPILFSTGNSTFGALGYQNGAGAANVSTYSVTANTIGAAVGSTTYFTAAGNCFPIAVQKLTGTTKFAALYSDSSVAHTNVITITSGTAIAVGTDASSGITLAASFAGAINVYDATHYTFWNNGCSGQAATPKYFTESAGSPTLVDPSLSLGTSICVLIGFIDNATALVADASASAASFVKVRKVLFNGSAFSFGGVVEAPTNAISDISSALNGFTLCGGVAVMGNANVAEGMKYSFLNKGRMLKYVPRLATGNATGGSLVDSNSAGTRVAACHKGFDNLLVPLMMEIPTY